MVTPGSSYFLVQDTRAGRGTPGDRRGPPRAIEEFLRQQSEADPNRFVVDRKPERFLFSQHAGGFLRKLEAGEHPGTHDSRQAAGGA